MPKIFNRVLTAKNQGLPEDRQANARENIGVYSKDEIDQLIGEFGGFKIAPGDAEGHPDVSDKNPKIIYLVKVDGATDPDLYREWIWATDEETGVYDWICIGDTSADLSDMARKSEMSVTESGDRTAVQLADGISATVLNEHQDISGKADKATTLGGYGITDAHITDNVITLGEATVDMSLYASAEGLAGEVSRATAKEAELAGAIADEASRATAEETTLGETISGEITRATGAETTLNTAIVNETARAEAAESSLGVSITAETTRAEGAEEDLNTAIVNEAARAQEAESSLEANIASEADRAASAEAGLNTAIVNETTRAQGAESNLNASITAETTRAEGAETDLNTAIANETTRAQGAESNLNASITAETTRAEGAEAGLSTNIASINEKIPASASASNQLATASDLPDLSGYVMEAAAPLKIVDGTNGKKVTNNGADLTVTGTNAWAEGNGNTASGTYSHAEGSNNSALGFSSHAEGLNNTVTAGAGPAHVEGQGNTASSDLAHAEGEQTTASGPHSHSQGFATIASGNCSCAMGLYNLDSTGLLVVGNGTSNERSDCFKIDSTGKLHFLNDGTLTELNFDTTTFQTQLDGLIVDDDKPLVSEPDVTLVSQLSSNELLARRAYEDENGANIKDTYATKTDTEQAITELQSRFGGAVGVTASNGVSVTMNAGILDFRHTILVANETATLVQGTSDEYEVTAALNAYTMITVPQGASKLTVNVPEAVSGVLQEAAFQFDVGTGEDFDFDVKTGNTRLKRIAPLSLTAGNSYQGTVVGGLCTLGEFEPVEE